MKLSRTLIAALAVAAAGLVRAQTPVQSQAVIPAGDTSVAWAVPAGMSGALLSLQADGVTNAATLAVSHVIPYVGGTITNTVETAAAGNTLLAYPSVYLSDTNTPALPVWLCRGDWLLITASAASGRDVTVVIRAAN